MNFSKSSSSRCIEFSNSSIRVKFDFEIFEIGRFKIPSSVNSNSWSNTTIDEWGILALYELGGKSHENKDELTIDGRSGAVAMSDTHR